MSYQEVVLAHRAQLDRVVERAALPRLRRMYDEAQRELEAKLRRAVGAGRGGEVSAHQYRVLLIQVREAQQVLAARMADEVTGSAVQARAESIHQLHADVAKMDSRFGRAAVRLPTEQAGVFHDVANRGRTSLLAAHRASMARYGAASVGAMEGALSLSLAAGDAPHEAVSRVMEAGDTEFWQAERIVRTEISWASASAMRDAVAEDARADPGLWLRWNEHVSDAGTPLDDRVGDDSLAMHGQVALPGGQFTLPPTTPVGKMVDSKLVGQTWEHPPNRPNDRAALAPWRPSWGSPGWRWQGGARVPVLDLPEAPVPEVGEGRVKAKRVRRPRVEVAPDPVAEARAVSLVAVRDDVVGAWARDLPAFEERVVQARGRVAEAEAGTNADSLPARRTAETALVLRREALESAEANLADVRARIVKLEAAAQEMVARAEARTVKPVPAEVHAAAENLRQRGHLSVDEQRVARQAVNDLLAAKGLVNRDLRHKMSHAMEFHNIGVNVAAWHEWDGKVVVHEKSRAHVADALGYLADRAAGKLGNPTPEVVGALNTLVHEAAHGHSRMTANVYQGAAAKVEEVTTEVAARRTVRDLVGAGELAKPEHYSGATWYGQGRPPEVHAGAWVPGAYGEDIGHVLDHVQAVAGVTRLAAVEHLEAASLKFKRGGNIITDGDEYVRQFAGSFKLPKKQQELLRKKLAGETRGWQGK